MIERENTGGAEASVREDWDRWTASLRSWFRRNAAPAEAEDLTQETLLRVLQHLPELERADRLEPWMRRIARNVLIDRRRAERPLEELAVEPGARPEAFADDSTGDSVEPIVAGWLEAVVDSLPETDASILRRSELERRSVAEIAAETGLAVSSVKSRIQRGRAKVKARLLACCRFERDRRGGLVDFERRGPDCAC